MWIYDKRDKVENNLKTYMDMEKFPEIRGQEIEDLDDEKKRLNGLLDGFLNMGFQGSNLGMAIEIAKNMLKEKKEDKSKIFLSFTGNMISSGNRELIRYLVKNKYIDGITTNAAGIEEDIIKSIKSFHLGAFNTKGKHLLDECVGRIGNIFVPADRYLYLERFLNDIFPKIGEKAKSGNVMASHQIISMMGDEIGEHELTREKREESFIYWAAKNGIPVFCPGMTDGAIGDMAVFYRRKNKDFAIDSTKDNEVLSKILMETEKCGSIILGGGIAKHFLLNAAIFRDGFDSSVYLTTAASFDGSDSGGNQEEAISWAKIKPEAERVKVVCDATISFPILVMGMLQDSKKE